MLGKLLKYDLKWTFKFLSVFYALTLFFSILTRIFLNFENSLIMHIIGQICTGATISMIFNILINNTLRIWIKFKQNFYGDESYLTHTLPVKKSSLYLSKMLTATISLLASILFIVLSLFAAYYSKANLEMLKNLFLPLFNALDISLLGVLSAFLLIFFLEIVNILQCGFTGIIIGHRFNSGKTGLSVLFWFITYIVSQIAVLLIMFIFALFNKDFMNLFVTNEMINTSIIKVLVYFCMVVYSVISIIFFAINVKLFKKGVNVD